MAQHFTHVQATISPPRIRMALAAIAVDFLTLPIGPVRDRVWLACRAMEWAINGFSVRVGGGRALGLGPVRLVAEWRD